MDNRVSRRAEAKSTQILQAMLDMFSYPVWITDQEGNFILNSQAQQLVAGGCNIQNFAKQGDCSTIMLHGKRFFYRRRDMNNGTGCLQHELHDADEPRIKLERCTAALEAVLAPRA